MSLLLVVRPRLPISLRGYSSFVLNKGETNHN